jgi:gluconate 2-dehydrogenase gamma chain
MKSAAGGTVVLASLPVLGIPDDNSKAPGCKFFTPAQATLVGAIASQIVPADDFPNGKDAGVVFYIDGVLSGTYGKFYIEQYASGLKLIDELTHKQFNCDFSSATSDQQIAILKSLEAEEHGSEGREFFFLLLRHTMEGYYGDSQYGGNRDEVSWKMIGFEG